jgi:hypothetical protein
MRPLFLFLIIAVCLVSAAIAFQVKEYSPEEREMDRMVASLQQELGMLPPHATLVFNPVPGRPELLAWARLGLIPRTLEELRRSPDPDTLLIIFPASSDEIRTGAYEIKGRIMHAFRDTVFHYYLIDQTG